MPVTVSDSTRRCTPNNTTVLRTGAGGILAIFASSNSASPGVVTLYDNTAGSGTILFDFAVASPQPFLLQLDQVHQLRFTTGLTAVVPPNIMCFVETYE